MFSKYKADYKFDFGYYRDDDGAVEIPKEGTGSGTKLFYPNISQVNFSKIPGNLIAYWASEKSIQLFEEFKLLGDFYLPMQGMATTDNKQFLREWYEVDFRKIGLELERDIAIKSDFKWFPYNKGGGFRKYYGNQNNVVNYENNGAELKTTVKEKYRTAEYAEGFSDEKWDKLIEVWVLKNQHSYFKKGITWSFISSDAFGVRFSPSGFIFDVGGSIFDPNSTCII